MKTPNTATAIAFALTLSLTAPMAPGEKTAPAAPAAPAAAAPASDPAAAPARPQIEVCFVLDTTGSMSGLIAGAKEKIWSIANEIVAAEPSPDLRVGLIGYRDRGDEYVTQTQALTDDLDLIYGKLMGFEAKGGGDTPESVNQALHEAVTQMGWNADRRVLKIIFLVGDAPPHMDYADDVKYPATCEAAVRQDLIINTIQCGRMGSTRKIWEEIASRSEGGYAAIEQGGGMRTVSTPVDGEITRLSAALADTVIPYGDDRARGLARAKTFGVTTASPFAAAERSRFLAKKAEGKVITGEEDLLSELEDGAVTVTDLDEAKLPEALKDLSEEARAALIAEKTAERKRIQVELAQRLKERDAFLAEAKASGAELTGARLAEAETAPAAREPGEKPGALPALPEAERGRLLGAITRAAGGAPAEPGDAEVTEEVAGATAVLAGALAAPAPPPAAAPAQPADGFDDQVRRLLRKQAAKKGIHYKEDDPAPEKGDGESGEADDEEEPADEDAAPEEKE